ncbi:RAB6A-GEF complex partner protein 2, partial [Tremellales sp. Uapishka_1]
MSAYFPFSSSATSSVSHGHDDPHLEVTIIPSSSAFYAGETFSATITFRNTRAPPHGSSFPVTPTTVAPRHLPAPQPRDSSTGSLPTRKRQIGVNLDTNAEAGPSRLPPPLVLASPVTPTPGYPYSPGANPSNRAGWPSTEDKEMSFRSPEAWKKENGHGRRAKSLALGGGMSPQEMVWALGGEGELTASQPVAVTHLIRAGPPHLPVRRLPNSAIPSSHPHSRKISIAQSIASPPSAPAALPSLESIPETRPSATRASSSSSSTARRPRNPNSPLSHSRTPSYHNAYGASLLGVPPPVHPSLKDIGTTTILWAHTRLVAHFSPSITYIPPDPLLPLRAKLLHQPVGSGTLTPQSLSRSQTSRWQLSFGTGTIGQATQPSLTGSLFGLAKDLVYGGDGGSLEEERKRVWNMKDLPVLESVRSLVGVDVKLKEGESRESFRFSYELLVSLNVAVGKNQKSKEIAIPIRVWANVSLTHPLRTYDVLRPIIQTTEEGTVSDTTDTRRSSITEKARVKGEDTLESLQSYAKHLLDTLKPDSLDLPLAPRLLTLSPTSHVPALPHLPMPTSPEKAKFKTRPGSFIDGDDELEVGEEGGCGEAVEILSRHSPKTSYDIAKEGEMVAVLTLIKTTYRLGETVLGVVTFNQASSERRVLKFSAFLESHEIIPETLLPPSSKPPALSRLHAEHRTGYTIHTSQLSFGLDIPSDATPAFSLAAGEEGSNGGLEWRIRLSFLVSVPARKRGMAHSLVKDEAKGVYVATASLSPVVGDHEGYKEAKTEVVDCEVPVKVLAGNTAFVVRPSVSFI